MTPDEAIARARAADAADDNELVDAFALRLTTRSAYAHSRICRTAGLILCADRGHDRHIRACPECRTDITLTAGI